MISDSASEVRAAVMAEQIRSRKQLLITAAAAAASSFGIWCNLVSRSGCVTESRDMSQFVQCVQAQDDLRPSSIQLHSDVFRGHERVGFELQCSQNCDDLVSERDGGDLAHVQIPQSESCFVQDSQVQPFPS